MDISILYPPHSWPLLSPVPSAFLRPPRQSLRYSLRSPRFAPLRGEWNGVSEAWRVVRQGATIRLLTQLVSLAYTYRNEPG